MSQIKETTGKQYNFKKILGLWALVTLPMIALSLASRPLILRFSHILPATPAFMLLMMPGMLWQLALSLWIIYREEGNLRLETIRRRIWLNPPLHPTSGQPKRHLYVWSLLLPALVSLGLIANRYFSGFESSGSKNMLELAGPLYAGQWWILGLMLAVWIPSALLAEEFFFRGILLPKMRCAFGKLDWLINAMLYGLYFLYQPLMIPFQFIKALVIAWPARRFHSNRMTIIMRSIEGVGLVAIALLGILSPILDASPTTSMLPYISRQPAPADYTWMRVKTEFPVYDPHNPDFSSGGSLDLRSVDMSSFNLRNSSEDLLYASFDSVTAWPPPEQMPDDFYPQQIMEIAKNPGLGLRQLHEQGITGSGVNIAIVDQILLTNHQEYADQLKWYEEFGTDTDRSEGHGPAVASIAVGKTVGVAPEAGLYYIGTGGIKQSYLRCQYYAMGIRRILEINRQLPENQKIRVISISSGWGFTNLDTQAAAEEARDAGMLVIFSNVEKIHKGFDFSGLGREPLADPDIFGSYKPGLFWAKYYYDRTSESLTDALMVPMDARTMASPTGVNDYTYDRSGGISWSIPYIAGLYALVAQVEPDITPDRFWPLALETGRTVEIEHEGQTYSFGTIIDPPALIAALQTEQQTIR